MTRLTTILMLSGLLLAGCNTDPSTSVAQPMTIKPPVPAASRVNTGSIYSAATSRGLFDDRRARFVGDTLTVKIVERTSATKSSAESFERSGEVDVNIPTPTILGQTPKKLPFVLPGFSRGDANGNDVRIDTTMSSSASSSFDNSDRGSNSNSFSGSIAVTVIEVLANGNLVVSGEKQVAINEKTEFIRLSGVVNPITINIANEVNSTQLADARIESKDKQSMDTAQLVSMLSRFFLTLVPF